MPRYPSELRRSCQSNPNCSATTFHSLGDLPEDFASAVKVDEAKPANAMSRPPGILCSSVIAMPVVTTANVGPVGLCSEAYQWSQSATAYRGARDRTPRRGRLDSNQEQNEATEEDWSRRERKRDDPVKGLKATSVYLDNQDADPRPQTPDPAERQSKRKWETKIANWRNEYREIDGVRKLVEMGFDPDASLVAWRKAKPKGDQQRHDHEAHLQEAVNRLGGA
jgi:hypothetical protein